MNFRTLIRRSLRFHWRSHLGVVIGAAIGSAALIGALIVGDSVKGSLRERALERIANTWAVMDGKDRQFSSELTTRMYERISHGYNATVNFSTGTGFDPKLNEPLPIAGIALRVEASISRQDGVARVNAVTVFGGDTNFTKLSLKHADSYEVPRGSIVLNADVAKQIEAHPGNVVLLRINKPSQFSRDSVMADRAEEVAAMRLVVDRVLPVKEGNISFNSKAGAVKNVFVNSDELASRMGLAGRANLLAVSRGFHWRPPGTFTRFQIALAEWWYGDGVNPFSDLRWLKSSSGVMSANSEETAVGASQLLANVWLLEDAQSWLYSSGANSQQIELRTSRIFLDPPLVRSALAADTNAQPILTYLANLITVGSNATPYSMVTAAGAPWTPPDLRDDEIILNQWLADDLQAKPGDVVTLVYFDPESGARLTERTNTFRIHSIVPMQMPWADRTLMPQFPGIEKAETTAEWDTAFPLTHKIRPQDDEYWTEHRGTPKAFITLAAGQKMWANRFGNLTAIRFPIPTNFVMVGDEVTSLHSASEPTPSPSKEGIPKSAARTNAVPLLGGVRGGLPTQLETPHVVTHQEEFRTALEKKILATLKPEELGLRFEPVREQALKAVEQSQDFGGLFIGFSLFVIVAALLLMAMLFRFSLEQRSAEIGTLLALGFSPKQVRRLFLREGAALAFIGGIIGTLGGIGYARAMLHGLTTVWRDAVGASALKFFVTPQTLGIGLFASTLVATFTLWIALRQQARQPARVLLAGALECGDLSPPSPAGDRSQHSKVGWLALVAALGLVIWAIASGDAANAGVFFGAGALVLIAGLAFVNVRLQFGTPSTGSARLCESQQQAEQVLGAPVTLRSLAFRGLTRRRSRSIATVAMLASGTFLIVSIGVFRLDANRDATRRTSGTGGFALIGESTMPVVADLNTKAGRETFALNEADFTDVNFVQFRVRAGDEASCLNLNRAQKPRLLGVKPEAMAGRFAFVKGDGWPMIGSSGRESAPFDSPKRVSRLTSAATGSIEIPALGDANSIQWAMGKKVGDTLDYVDERGQPFKVRIVGAVANSILQGQLIIDETEFVKRFPSESGYKYFLIDAPTNRVADVSAKLSRALQDAGLELTPAPQRLAQFNAVQNTYLGTFQILGGLGLLLGSAGLGIVVLRNVLERRGELAVLLAVGWLRQQVRRLVLAEHAALLGFGLVIGIVAAFVAVLPSLLTPGADLPWLSLGATLFGVCANGLFWAWLATRVALRGNVLGALRGE